MKIERYEDKISGKRTARPGLDALRKDIFSGKIKTVIVWKLDRLSRSVLHLLQLLQDLRENGVDFIALTQNRAYSRCI